MSSRFFAPERAKSTSFVHRAQSQPFRSTWLSFLAVLICVLVLWPRTGKPIACLLPLYVPISLNLLMLSCTIFLASFSIVIVDSSAVNAVIVLCGKEPIFIRGWMQYLARIRVEVCGPTA